MSVERSYQKLFKVPRWFQFAAMPGKQSFHLCSSKKVTEYNFNLPHVHARIALFTLQHYIVFCVFEPLYYIIHVFYTYSFGIKIYICLCSSNTKKSVLFFGHPISHLAQVTLISAAHGQLPGLLLAYFMSCTISWVLLSVAYILLAWNTYVASLFPAKLEDG